MTTISPDTRPDYTDEEAADLLARLALIDRARSDPNAFVELVARGEYPNPAAERDWTAPLMDIHPAAVQYVRTIVNAMAASPPRSTLGAPAENVDPTPVPALVTCPKCELPHVDRDGWETVEKSHRTHLCERCGHLWRPYPFATVGVEPLEHRIGKPIPWAQVPTHSIVEADRWYHVRIANRGWAVGATMKRWIWDSIEDGKALPWQPDKQWGTPWISEDPEDDPETAIPHAFNLRGDESAEELRALVESAITAYGLRPLDSMKRGRG